MSRSAGFILHVTILHGAFFIAEIFLKFPTTFPYSALTTGPILMLKNVAHSFSSCLP